MNVKSKVRNVAAVQSFLRSVPRGMLKVALEAFTEYIIGNDAHGLKHNDPYKYVTRKSAYGVSFFTEKQRRWFWANGGPDMIGKPRTGKTSEAWKAVPSAGGYQYKIVNSEASAYHIRDDAGQARQPAKVGWRKVSKVLADNMAGGIRAAVAAVKKYLATKK